jgi:acyl dehydratase
MSELKLQVGEALPGFERTITATIMFSRQYHGSNVVHSNPELAKVAGLKAPVATGQISAAYIQEMCVRAFGEAMFRGSVLDVRFRRPAYLNDTLAIGGEITEVREVEGGRRVFADAWARNAQGEDVTRVRVEVSVPGPA